MASSSRRVPLQVESKQDYHRNPSLIEDALHRLAQGQVDEETTMDCIIDLEDLKMW